MSHIRLRCTRCAAAYAADMASLVCRECGALLEVDYLDDTAGPQPRDWAGPKVRLPLHDLSAVVSMGEGNTPVVRLPTLGDELGLRTLYAKLEFLNPTGSYKDRGTAVMMSMAREHGVTEVVEDSSGNAGASVAAYAARAGIKAHVFTPASAPAAKIQQIKVYGAQAHCIDGNREAATEAATAYCSERDLVYASHIMSPYFTEGTKAFAYEVSQQLEGGPPGHVVIPVGNGALFIGAWKGFQELQRAGHISWVPRLHCIQARAVMPIAAAYIGADWSPSAAGTTVAGGISVSRPTHMRQVLDILHQSGGAALAVEDEEIIRWQRLLAEKEGIYAEPTSAAAFAGLERLVNGGEIQRSDSVLVPVTGFGLKDAPPG